MKTPYLNVKQTEDGWQSIFAFQVFHRQPDEWLRMRWGFNAGALLEEALDRARLFIESQSMPEAEYRSGLQPARTLSLRGMNHPGMGLQMGLLGKAGASSREEAQQNALSYARELFSIFPTDFIVIPAETDMEYDRLSGKSLLETPASVAQIQRGVIPVPFTKESRILYGFWQASSRSNEQIWRALSNMPIQTMFNVTMQPTYFYEGERRMLLDLKNQIPKGEQADELAAAHAHWLEVALQKRLKAWKKFFILQVHVVTEGVVDENLLRSIGSCLARDANDLSLPGFQVIWPDSETTRQSWCENILNMNFIPASRMEDMVDSDEAFAVFRYPYFPESGVPGAKFVTYHQEKSPPQNNQE